jgi:hypothetical protein
VNPKKRNNIKESILWISSKFRVDLILSSSAKKNNEDIPISEHRYKKITLYSKTMFIFSQPRKRKRKGIKSKPKTPACITHPMIFLKLNTLRK